MELFSSDFSVDSMTELASNVKDSLVSFKANAKQVSRAIPLFVSCNRLEIISLWNVRKIGEHNKAPIKEAIFDSIADESVRGILPALKQPHLTNHRQML